MGAPDVTDLPSSSPFLNFLPPSFWHPVFAAVFDTAPIPTPPRNNHHSLCMGSKLACCHKRAKPPRPKAKLVRRQTTMHHISPRPTDSVTDMIRSRSLPPS